MINKQSRLWIDTDITIGAHHKFLQYKDVDDGYALGSLMHSSEIEILGISSTRGNTDDINESTQIAKQFVQDFGANSYKVYQGAATDFKQDADSIPDAVSELAKQLEQGPMTILAIGALTNIALLLKARPDLAGKIEKVVAVAGRESVDEIFKSGTFQLKPFRDLNFEFDTAAFEAVLKSGVPVVLVPFGVCKKVWVDFEDLAKLRKQGPMGSFLARHAMGWWAEWEIIFGARQGFNPFDMVAAAYVLSPSWFTQETRFAHIVSAPSDTEKGVNKPYLVCNEEATGYPVSYCVDVESGVKADMLARLSKQTIAQQVLGLSHINVIVDDVEAAADYYQRVLGFERAQDEQSNAMYYPGVTMQSFALDAGLGKQQVELDVLFIKHPNAGIYIELMHYRKPQGSSELPPQPKTYDLGGPRHIAMEVANCNEVFHYLKEQEGVRMINPSEDYHPVELDGFPITFFYWIDRYGIQWEMEEGRRVGVSRGIV
ncbi:nucleoside hydrolase [Grimontia sp. NTOU-MAR1]|uniref:nucleoside hydrolase n=1 Tax=Grimontia sp. NTOU-MAR1 TaxID=3111011 RepID=UPI002DB799F7|nr:nucleoside hydrolase [Grimontia sp. NTOU-MAR1]WRV99014.1 nucleoside hydrolase [Grimontia sp. NTOU-MAR1]